MTVRSRHLGRVVLGFVVLCFVAGGLSVEAVTRDGVSRARRVLPGALARAVASDDLGEAAATKVAAARRAASRDQPRDAARALEDVLAAQPSAALHHAAALARLAAGDGPAAARHAQLAARLAPEDAAIAATAERTLDLALAWQLRPFTRPVTVVAGALLVFLLLGALRRHHGRKRMKTFLENLSARVQAWADGEPLSHPLAVGPRTGKLTLDVFLSGRYGMARPRHPNQAPTLHMAFSSAGSNQTIRLRPIPHVTDSAIRVPVSGETLARLIEKPGRWRLHLRLGERPILAVPFEVRAAEAHAAPVARHRLHARG